MGGKITLYVDIISPFAYIAYYMTRHSPAFKSPEITYTPILLGGLMQATNNTPPINIRNKDKWIGLERERWAKTFNIPISEKVPSPFPQPTVNTQRALCYISQKHGQEKLIEALDALYKAFWVDGVNGIGKVEVIQEVLGKGEWVEGIKSEEVKKLLKENTEKAFADGAFGLPWFVAENGKGEKEGFWGVDHVGQMLDFLGVESRGQTGYKSLL